MLVDLLSEHIRSVLKTASESIPASGLGVIRNDGPEQVVFTYMDSFGLTAYRTAESEIPLPFRLGSGFSRLSAADLSANPLGLVESRLLQTGFSDEIRERYSVQQLFAVPVPDNGHGAMLLVVSTQRDQFTAAQVAELDTVASTVGGFLDAPEPPDGELIVLRRLEEVERLLPALFHVLDVREIFDRLSATAKLVLRHDFASLGILNDDLTRVEIYAETTTFSPQGGPMPFPKSQTAGWLYRFVDDLTTHPLERSMQTVRVGGRSSLRVAIRLDEQILGILNFTSRDPEPYTAADLVIAQRIADYVAIGLSHQRLAEQARRNEELRSRTTNMELLDELLGALIDSGELSDVFGRISAITAKVLPHDAAALWGRLPAGTHARAHAKIGFPPEMPDIVEIPADALRESGWDDSIFDDLTAAPEPHRQFSKMGFRSFLRVPIHLDERFAGAFTLLSKTPAAFKASDLIVARRIADRLRVIVAHDREVNASKRADEATERATKLEARVRALTDELDSRTGYRRVVGESREWRLVLKQATQVAATEATVLLLGESGTGKEVVARFVHRASNRSIGPFVALNCAALPEHLLEAELFGYERGAFTGAMQSKPGQLEQASGGTLFLDEVGEMTLPAQAKFLRVLQEREFQRLGGTRVLRTDARVVAATNRDLTRAISLGQFREDLYYRLNVFAINLPALRDRPDDILPLSEAFLVEIGRGLGRPPAGISKDARKLLTEYHWPGNVRELRNLLERAAILCDGGLITSEHFSVKLAPPRVGPPPREVVQAATAAPMPSSAEGLDSIEREMIEQALQKNRFNKSKTAETLGLTRQQLYARMRKHGLE